MRSSVPARLFLISTSIFIVSSLLSLIVSTQLGTVTAMLAKTSVASIATPTASPGASATPTPLSPPTPTLPPELQQSPIPALIARDTFDRPDQPYWGIMEQSVEWEGEASIGPSAFIVQNNTGRINGEDKLHSTYFDVTGFYDTEQTVSGSLSTFDGNTLGIYLRHNNQDTWYGLYIDGISLILERNIEGTRTQLGVYPFKAQPDTVYTLTFIRIKNVLAAKVWPVGSSEPTTWQLIATGQDRMQSYYGGIYATLQKGSSATITEYTAHVLFI